MEQRKIGKLDLRVDGVRGINFGMRIDEYQTGEVVDSAPDSEINLFDTADMYDGT